MRFDLWLHLPLGSGSLHAVMHHILCLFQRQKCGLYSCWSEDESPQTAERDYRFSIEVRIYKCWLTTASCRTCTKLKFTLTCLSKGIVMLYLVVRRPTILTYMKKKVGITLQWHFDIHVQNILLSVCSRSYTIQSTEYHSRNCHNNYNFQGLMYPSTTTMVDH